MELIRLLVALFVVLIIFLANFIYARYIRAKALAQDVESKSIDDRFEKVK